MTAIQESTDFSGRYGPVDTSALTRLIDVHQTPILHGVDTRRLTSSRAVGAYLGFAKEKLVLATQGGPLAADAILILARLEAAESKASQVNEAVAGHSRMHASELALMYRRAAVEIAPDNPQAAADLGRTLLTRSLPVDAKRYLQQSVQQAPTRQSVEDLLRAASLAGDFVVVDQCEKTLVARQLPSELPVTFLPPDQFARTHQRYSGETQSNIARQSSPNVRVASRPSDTRATFKGRSSHYRGTPSTDSRIVDPTMPSPTNIPTSLAG